MHNSRSDLEKYLPHRGKMVLLDKIICHSIPDEKVLTEVAIHESSMFFDEKHQYVPAWVGIEYMAQTIAAYSGIRRTSDGDANTPPRIGLLLGARKYRCATPGFPLGQVLNIEAKQSFFGDNLASFDCIILADGEILAEAQVTAYEPESLDGII